MVQHVNRPTVKIPKVVLTCTTMVLRLFVLGGVLPSCTLGVDFLAIYVWTVSDVTVGHLADIPGPFDLPMSNWCSFPSDTTSSHHSAAYVFKMPPSNVEVLLLQQVRWQASLQGCLSTSRQ